MSFLLALYLALLPAGALSTAAPQIDGFWLSAELLSVDFRKSCLSTALCHKPAFKLKHTMTLNGQTALMSWPVEEIRQRQEHSGGEAQDQSRQFVSHWTTGDPEDVSIGCEIAGTDPSFGFARVCDETPSRRVFQEALVQRTVLSKRGRREDEGENSAPTGGGGTRGPADATNSNDDENGDTRMVVEMRGRCFNATLAVRKHTTRCPWCPDPNVHIHVEGGKAQQSAELSDAQQQMKTADALLLHNIVIVALSGAVVFAFTGLCIVLVAQRRYRKKHVSAKNGRKTTTSGKTLPHGANAAGTLMLGQQQAKRKRILKLVSPPRPQRSLPVSPQGTQRGMGMECEEGEMVYAGQSRGIVEREDRERYDTPWDAKYCLVPRQWLVGQPPAESPFQFLPPHQPHGPPSFHFGGDAVDDSKYATCNDSCQRSPMVYNMARPPPPPPPPNASRHSHSQLPQFSGVQNPQQQTFSPNTSGSMMSRQDDSGLDSV